MGTKGYTHPSGRVSHFDPLINPGHKNNPGLWATCPLLEYLSDPSIGVYLREDFVSYNAAATSGDYVLTQATAGTGAISTAAPGVFELDCNSTTEGQGAQIQRVKSAFLPAAGKDIWFETTLKVVDTYDKIEFFAGLSEIDTSIIASQANSSANHIGWQCVTDNGILLFSAEKAGAGATTAATTLAEATYVKLGFRVKGVTEIEQYINGVLVGTNHVTANIPVVAVYPSFVCQTGDTNDPILHIAGYQVFQLR
jgi:hypothetical protein